MFLITLCSMNGVSGLYNYNEVKTKDKWIRKLFHKIYVDFELRVRI